MSLRDLVQLARVLHRLAQLEKSMSQIADKVTAMEADIAKMKGDFGTVAASLKALQDQVAALQAQLAAGTPVTQADLDALDQLGKDLDGVTAQADVLAGSQTPPQATPGTGPGAD